MNGYFKLSILGVWTLFIFGLSWFIHTRFDQASTAAADQAQLVALQQKSKANEARAAEAESSAADAEQRYEKLLLENANAKHLNSGCNLPIKWVSELKSLPTAVSAR